MGRNKNELVKLVTLMKPRRACCKKETGLKLLNKFHYKFHKIVMYTVGIQLADSKQVLNVKQALVLKFVSWLYMRIRPVYLSKHLTVLKL